MNKIKMVMALGVIANFVFADNLVKNGDFEQGTLNWKIVSKEQDVSAQKVDDKNVLQAIIKKKNRSKSGEIVQTVNLPRNTEKIVLSCDMKASNDGVGFMQIKLRRDRSELKRISTEFASKDWKTITKTIEVGDADNIQVLCRFSQKTKSLGTKCYWTNIKVEAIKGENMVAVTLINHDVYITSDGAGQLTGKDWANALSADTLQDSWDAIAQGKTIFLGSGTYDQLSFKVTPANSKNIILAGVDTGKGIPQLVSTFDKDNPAKTGKTFCYVAGDASDFKITNLDLTGYNQVVSMHGNHSNVEFSKLDIKETRDAFVIAGPSTKNIKITDCNITGYTKRGVRIRDGVSELLIQNVHADSGGKEWATEAFPVGFHVEKASSYAPNFNITYINCSGKNNWHTPEAGRYWNADGFGAEGGCYGIKYLNCFASGNTDGGWDDKSDNPVLENCIAIANKRNFRFWSDKSPTMTNCISAYAIKYGGSGDANGIWVSGRCSVTLKDCTLYKNSRNISLEPKNGKVGKYELTNCLILGGKDDASMDANPNIKIIDCQFEGTLQKPSSTWNGKGTDMNPIDSTSKGFRNK
ncbi:MAG: hypothetical protein PF692_03215 [Kiritimatiellae bacterium]|jgi:hypothetical protein|nr:hypothetical protein [Kiritimatiellia bacterium]